MHSEAFLRTFALSAGHTPRHPHEIQAPGFMVLCSGQRGRLEGPTGTVGGGTPVTYRPQPCAVPQVPGLGAAPWPGKRSSAPWTPGSSSSHREELRMRSSSGLSLSPAALCLGRTPQRARLHVRPHSGGRPALLSHGLQRIGARGELRLSDRGTWCRAGCPVVPAHD